MSDSFDTPATDDVLQDDEIDHAIPVVVDGVVRVDEMPTRLGMVSNVLLRAGDEPRLIVPENPRRKKLILWIYYAGSAPADTLVGAMIGRDMSEITSGFTGPVLHSMNAITRYEFSFQSALWGKSVNVENTTDNFDGIVDGTNDVLVNAVSEDWAR